MNSSTTLFASVPKLEDLCYVRCIFSNLQMTHAILKEVYHCQIAGCRDIIRHFPKAISSPVPSTERYGYVIVSKKFFETKKLQTHLKLKSIHYTDPQEVTFEIFKICAKYSITYRLLPVWNRVGEYLCRGQKSTELTDELEAIKFDLDIKEEGMFLKFNPLKLKLCHLSLEALEMSKPTLEKFQNTPNMCINFRRRKKAYILPTLKKCNILKITKEIPKTCKFENYKVIRDHWKYMYGIVMPKSPEGIIYYEVSFTGFEYRIFIYPEICLQIELPKIINCNNQGEISSHFLEDLKVKVPQICGKELSFSYQNVKPPTNFLKPKEVQRGNNVTPSKSLMVKNQNFCSSSNDLKVFNYDSKTLSNFSFQRSFDSPTKTFDSNSASFSFQNKVTMRNYSKGEDARPSPKLEFVSNWLLNSCASPASSVESYSQQSREKFEKTRDSPLEKRKKLSDAKIPSIRSIETVKISLSDLKKGIVTRMEKKQPPKK